MTTTVDAAELLNGPDTNCRVAQVWASLGCTIVPWRYQTDGARRRKKPSIKGWTRGAAFTTPAQCVAWWQDHALDYPGIVTGPRSGVWVLDLDGEAAVARMKELVAEHGPIPPEVLRVRTPSGANRWHYYFAWEDGIRNSQSRLGPGIDIRGEGGYVAAPGSITLAGKYEQPDHPPVWQPAPAWLLKLVRELPPMTREWDADIGELDSTEQLAVVKPGYQDEALFSYLAAQHRRGAPANEARDAAWLAMQGWEQGNPSDPWTLEDVQEKVESIWRREEFRGVIAPVEPWMKDFVARYRANPEVALGNSFVVEEPVVPASPEVQAV